MAEPFLSEIRIMSFNFPPKGWALCNGQFMPINQNQALFSLLGTTYGGDGKSTFALPNLQGSAPMHPGQGPNLSNYDLGQSGGTQAVTLLESEMPSHNHTLTSVAGFNATDNSPQNNVFGKGDAGLNAYNPGGRNLVTMAFQAVGLTGSSLPHNNMMPSLTLYFCIALQGVFPPRG